jgi:flagellar basal body-associated protein FliL
MKKLSKKALIIIGSIEAVILIFALTISILVLTTNKGNTEANKANPALIAAFQANPLLLLLCIVIPVFIIFVVDGVYLIYYSTKKESALSDEERNAIQEEARRQAREEVMKSIMTETAQKDAKPAEQAAPKAEEEKK